MKKTGKIITGIVIAACVAGAGFYVWKYTDLLSGKASAEDKVYVESVAAVVSNYGGGGNRYMGTVEAQETVEVNAASDRTVKSILVEVGDAVEEGDKLFTYDTSEAQQQIDSYKLDLEKYESQIAAYNKQIKEIETQRDKAIEKKTAKDSDLLDYTTQIQSIQLSIQDVENQKKNTSLSIEKCRNQMNNSYVTAKIAGTVKQVNDPNSSVADQYMSSSALIVIEANGDYRIKGQIDEQNVWTISEGQAVVVRSRVDDSIWHGVISEIKTEAESNQNNGGVYYGGSDTEKATKYPFYITLDTTDGLHLGQHLYIEMDYGQTEEKEGIWLNSGYLVMEDGDTTNAFVWTRNDKDKLEKRKVELGEYDADMDLYEIVSGLAMTDYVAFPMDSLYEGVTCVTDMNEVDYSSPLYNSGEEENGEYTDEYVDSEYTDGENMDGEYTDDSTISDGETMDQNGMVDENGVLNESEEEVSTEELSTEAAE